MNAAQKRYFDELFLDCIENGVTITHENFDAEVHAAHLRRQAFIVEMLENKTDRAKTARELLLSSIYHDARSAARIDALKSEIKAIKRGAQIGVTTDFYRLVEGL